MPMAPTRSALSCPAIRLIGAKGSLIKYGGGLSASGGWLAV